MHVSFELLKGMFKQLRYRKYVLRIKQILLYVARCRARGCAERAVIRVQVASLSCLAGTIMIAISNREYL